MVLPQVPLLKATLLLCDVPIPLPVVSVGSDRRYPPLYIFLLRRSLLAMTGGTRRFIFSFQSLILVMPAVSIKQ